MSEETCLKLKTRTVKLESSVFGLGFGAGMELAFFVGEFVVAGLAMFFCCLNTDIAKSDDITK